MDEQERLRRWRLVLGGDSEETIGARLSGEDRGMDGLLAALYGAGGLGGNSGGPRSAGLVHNQATSWGMDRCS